MKKSIQIIVMLFIVLCCSFVDAQQIRLSIGGGFGGYGGYGGFGGGMGYGYSPLNAYNSYNYSQQLFQQQSSQTSQIFQQQQQEIIDQIREAQHKLKGLESIKQKMFLEYLDMSESDKSAVKANLMADYLKLDSYAKESWKRDEVVQTIIGPDLARLDGVARFLEMDEVNKYRFRETLLQKYRLASPSEQRMWRNDQVIKFVLGEDWR